MQAALFARADRWERQACVAAAAIARSASARRLFTTVSRLGDGPLWYALICAMPLWLGHQGLVAAAEMALAGLCGLALYKVLKRSFVRERPFVLHAEVDCLLAPLDRYSFPSGHTLHAVLFSTIAIAWLPWLALLLVPFALLVAMSRVVLGLHYPSDVLVGAALGGGIGWLANTATGV